VKNIVDKIKVNDLRSLLKIILKVKTAEFNITLSDAHINLLLDFYFEGIQPSTYSSHISKSISNKNYFKSIATINNSKTYLKKHKILKKTNKGILAISEDYLPPVIDEDILLNINVLYLHGM